ncbi:MAG: hypothetical protein AAFV69_02500, partial [Pseudomonadota bacterium]
LRQWWIGVLAGYLVPFLVMIIMLTGFFTGNSSYTTYRQGGVDIVIDGRLTVAGWWSALHSAVMMGVIGGLVALVIWRIAYRRVVTRTRA